MRARHLITPVATVCALTLAVAACGSSSKSSTSASSTQTRTATAQTTNTAATSTTQSTGPATSQTSTATATASPTTLGGPARGFERVPLQHGPELASPATTQPAAVNGIQCKPGEQLAYHIHAHLAVFDDGTLYALPPGIGIPGSQVENSPQYGPVAVGGRCYFWLHTHTSDGVIHIESPTKRIYTLGDFFAVWRQPLSPTRVASLHGAITAFVNGRAWHRSPAAIPLISHEDIQLEIGQPAPPIVKVDWKGTGL